MVHILTTDTIYTLNVKPKYNYCEKIGGALGVVCIDRDAHTVAISSPAFLEEKIKSIIDAFLEIEDKINGEVL